MGKDINKILEDLYQIDGGLRAKEKELRQLVTQILVSKPDTKLDSVFVARLRSELLAEVPVPSQVNTVSPYAGFFGSLMSLRFAIVGGIVVLIIMIPLFNNSSLPFLKKDIKTG